jgi:hypothetical protein
MPKTDLVRDSLREGLKAKGRSRRQSAVRRAEAANGSRAHDISMPYRRFPTKDGLASGFVHPTLLKFIERLPSLVENDLLLSDSLIPAYDHIDLQRIELDAATDSARFLAGDQRRPGPAKRFENDVISM